jgi:putative two-component system hydrogenase maturation factor HypX/HoxX
MRILFLAHSFNSLTQRLFVELREAGHEVSVEFDINDAVTEDAVQLFAPELIIAPFLKRAIPASVWRRYTCFIVHPGIIGDRGPSALDWAILDAECCWGVTVLEANADMDAGDIWASVEFPMRNASKSSLYRGELTRAAVAAVRLAVARFQDRSFRPVPLAEAVCRGRQRPLVRQSDRQIHWRVDPTPTVLRKIRSADGFPGVKTELAGRELQIFDARPASGYSGTPGDLLAVSGPAVAVATADGAVWIGHCTDAESAHPFKLPASLVLAEETLALPTVAQCCEDGYRDIVVARQGDVAVIEFDFYNGAMGTEQCERLRETYVDCCKSGPRVIVLAGGRDFWSNGMHLNLIEASASPADESWRNINAIDDLAEAIIRTRDCLTIATLGGNTGAGGVFLARAADRVWAHEDVVLNPHYKDMGNLFGSEYWTYLMPRVCGGAKADSISAARLPMGVQEASRLGLVDAVVSGEREAFQDVVLERAAELACSADFDRELQHKVMRRDTDEASRPLADYRREELERMRQNFYGFDPSYHIARYNFVYKVPRSHTPLTIARHRRVSSPEVRQAL